MTRNEWIKFANDNLAGRTITRVDYLDTLDGDREGAVLQLDNGVSVVVSQDDEGNGPGALFLVRGDNQFATIPVLG
jgi:hypothetical protein